MFEKEFIISTPYSKKIISQVENIIKNVVPNKDNLYFYLRYTKTRRHKYIHIDTDADITELKKALCELGHVNTYESYTMLSAIYKKEELTSLEYVTLIKNMFNLSEEILFVPSEEACNELGISGHPDHYDIKVNINKIIIGLFHTTKVNEN
jgi:hypothetical protein